MVIIESSIFSKRIVELMNEDEYAALQAALIQRPDSGAIIPNSGGLRKLRWATDPQKGKSGGARIIYYWVTADNQIRMLFAYRKAKQENLTPEQLKLLKQLMMRW